MIPKGTNSVIAYVVIVIGIRTGGVAIIICCVWDIQEAYLRSIFGGVGEEDGQTRVVLYCLYDVRDIFLDEGWK